jgi:hypothetical protein
VRYGPSDTFSYIRSASELLRMFPKGSHIGQGSHPKPIDGFCHVNESSNVCEDVLIKGVLSLVMVLPPIDRDS